MLSCTDCPARSKCTKLCKKMEEYVNQDYIPQRESLMPDIDDAASILTKYPAELGTSELIAKIYFLDRKTPQEIADMLYVSKRYVNKCIKKYKQILTENLKKTTQK